jgi:hypothetical protein
MEANPNQRELYVGKIIQTEYFKHGFHSKITASHKKIISIHISMI